MRNILCFVFFIVTLNTVFSQSSQTNTNLYVVKHPKNDSIYLLNNPNHNNYKIEFLNIEQGLKFDTAIFVIDNTSHNVLRNLVYNVFQQKSPVYPTRLKIDRIDSNSKYLLRLAIARDSVYNLVVSDFTNAAKVIPFYTNTNQELDKPQLKRIIIDDSSLVRDPRKYAFKINSRLEQGEAVKLSFVMNFGRNKNAVSKCILTSTNQDVDIKNKEVLIKSIQSNGDAKLEFEISTSLTTDEQIPFLLRIINDKGFEYKQDIVVAYNKDYPILDSKKEINNKTIPEANVTFFRGNTINIKIEPFKNTWDRECRYSYNIREISTDIVIAEGNNVPTLKNNKQEISIMPKADGLYNVAFSVKEYDITPKNYFLSLNITPSITNNKIALNDFKWGVRFLQVAKFGYYLEFNSTLNNNSYDYQYDVSSQQMNDFDDYNSFYEFIPEASIISRDIGVGFAYRLNKNFILSAGLSYYSFGYKQQIKQYEYSDLAKYENKTVLISDYSVTRVINKFSLDYNLNKFLFGLTLSNYNKNIKNPRISINLGLKI
jgi:hypothetical protein